MITIFPHQRRTGVLKAAIGAGFTFEDLRNISVAICYELMEDKNWRGDVICEGAVDKWGPHVRHLWGIIRQYDFEARENINTLALFVKLSAIIF